MEFVKIEKAGVVKNVSKKSWDLSSKSLTQQGWSQLSNFSSDSPTRPTPVKKQESTGSNSGFIPPEIANTKPVIADPNGEAKIAAEQVEKPKSKGGRPKKA